MNEHVKNVFNHEELDAEHDKIQWQLDALKEIVETDFSEERFSKGIDSLMTMLEEHFGHEEFYMREKKYESIKFHTDQHANLCTVVEELHNKFKKNPSEAEAKIIFGFINEWLISHTIQADVIAGNFLKRRDREE